MWKTCTVCDTYMVSSYGEVKNKNTGKILKQKLDKSNCLMVNLSLGKRGNAKYYIVARLVALAFLPNPLNLTWVRHKDGNTLNNNIENLEWVKNRRSIQAQGECSCNSRMTKEQVQWCRDVYIPKDQEYGCVALAKKFGIASSTMSYILRGITYK